MSETSGQSPAPEPNTPENEGARTEPAGTAPTGERAGAREAEGEPDQGPAPAPESDSEHSEPRRPAPALSRVRRVRAAFRRAVDQADRARTQARDRDLRYEDSSRSSPAERGKRRAAAARTPPAAAAPTVRVSTPSVMTTRSAALDSLPSWLVRGGLASWLLLGLIIVVGLVFFATSQVVEVFIGVFMALVLTSILQPLVNLFARVMPRYPATFLGMLSALAVVAGLIAYVVTSVTSQWNNLALRFSDGVNTIVDFLEHGPLPLHLTQKELQEQIHRLLQEGQEYVQSNAPSLASEVVANAGTVVDVFAVLALAIFSTIFFLASGGRMWRWFLNELPATMRESVHRAAGAGWYTFAGYARGTMIVAFTDALMAGIFLQVVGVPLAAPLAVLVFIGAFIPIIGAPAAMLIAMMVALASKGVITMIVVCLGVAGIGQIEGHILQPLIMGRQVSLHPVVVIIGVAIGTYAAGLLGAIVAVPLISVAWAMYSELHVRDTPVVGELPTYSGSRG